VPPAPREVGEATDHPGRDAERDSPIDDPAGSLVRDAVVWVLIAFLGAPEGLRGR
jgi:hypothetical protein